MKKKSVLFYLDNYTPSMKSLSFEQKGMLFDAIVSYGGGIADMPEDMGLLSLAFDPIKATMDRDQEKYEQVCERNRKNGLKGGKPKQTQPNPLGSSGLDSEPTGTQANPNKPDKDKDKDTIQTKIQREHIPPDGGEGEKPEFHGKCPPANKDASLYHPKFIAFWNVYPMRNGKRGSKFKAFQEWWKVMQAETLTPDQIISEIERLRFAYGDYPKDAERWIKNAMWQDEILDDPTQEEGYMSPQQIHDNIKWDVIAKLKEGRE